MTAEEMKKEFNALYNMMANSDKVENMHVFGSVLRAMFDWFVTNKPMEAEEFLNQLESIRWRNYLTKKEAESIVSEMIPKAPWSYDAWKNAMTQLGLPMDDEPSYNSYALWAVMNQVYTDHAQTIADNILKMPLAQIPADQLIPGVRALALDLLLDKDGRYCVRSYFGI